MNPAVRERIIKFANGPRPVLITTDLDGTLTPIVDRPGEARVPRETIDLLLRLSKLARVVVITGRDINSARRMVPSDEIAIVGSHGLEATIDVDLVPEVDRGSLAVALERIEERIAWMVPDAHLHVEKKAISTAFHFRRAPEMEERLREALADLPPNLRLRSGRMVLEVMPNTQAGKDHALAGLVRYYRPKSLLAVGDDVTDVAMLREARNFRDRGVSVLCIGVSGGEETPPELPVVSDFVVNSPEEAVEALTLLEEQLQ